MQGEYRAVTALKWFVMPKMLILTHNFVCKKCQKSRYFCGRILARILCSRKVYQVFHVWIVLVNVVKLWNLPVFNVSKDWRVTMLDVFKNLIILLKFEFLKFDEYSISDVGSLEIWERNRGRYWNKLQCCTDCLKFCI